MCVIFALEAFLLSFFPLCSGIPLDLRRDLDLSAEAKVSTVALEDSATAGATSLAFISFISASSGTAAGLSSEGLLGDFACLSIVFSETLAKRGFNWLARSNRKEEQSNE